MSELALQLIEKEKQDKTEKLDLGKCDLTTFPDELFELTWLKELSLSNRIFSWDKRKWIESHNNGPDNHLKGNLPEKFLLLTSLKKVSLSSDYNRPFIIQDASVLSKISGLQSLDLSSNLISDYSFLEKLTGLQSLGLSYNQISDYSYLKSSPAYNP